ncbi:YbaB/EbfC family nucleoid-associated protein [Actinophytocola sp.]|uniref:YbaB/EbfC family nucleoid-associated protein n=1 Tax=Actinophytocola sp. TaxID=1872138 RepID=UPI0025C3974D|nr:YbaB/EbfC family nucleoid-associated protein [Actinophytocola sp.]
MSSADNWLRQAEEQSEQALAEAADLRTVVATTQGTARSADGLVAATVAPGGALVSLQLDDRVMGGTALALQTAIVDTVHRAGADAAAQLEQAIRPIVGDRYDEALKAAGSELPDIPELDAVAARRSAGSRRDEDDLSQENVFGRES